MTIAELMGMQPYVIVLQSHAVRPLPYTSSLIPFTIAKEEEQWC
jgi:hypothetical protein